MHITGKAFLSFGLMVIAAWVVITASSWPRETALFPIVIGVPVCFMALIELILCLRGKEATGEAPTTVDYQFSENEDPVLTKQRTWQAFLWSGGFILMILLLGFTIAVPLFVFLYLKFQSNEKWMISLTLTVSAWAFFYFLFVKFLDVPFFEGWLLKQLGM